MSEAQLYKVEKEEIKTDLKIRSREELNIRNYLENQNRNKFKIRDDALKAAIYAWWGGLIGCGMAATFLVGIGIPLQTLIQVISISILIDTIAAISLAFGMYGGYKNEIHKTKKERK